MASTKSLGNKHLLDKFYTKPETALSLIQQLDLSTYDYIIEPSAGSGAFSGNIDGCLAYDLSPEQEDIVEADWLTLDKSEFKDKKCLVIGNPPFGTGGNLAMKFILESAEFADTIAFILPKSFKKESKKNAIPLDYHVIVEEDLPANSFTLNGKDYSVPCVWQVWVKKDTLRQKTVFKRTTELFDFVSKDNADFRIQRIGGRAGIAGRNLDFSPNSSYFVKNMSTYTVDELIGHVNSIDFTVVNDTVGPRSLSKPELISLLEQKLGIA